MVVDEVLSIPAGKSFHLIKRYYIHACPDSYTYRDSEYVTFRSDSGGFMEVIYNLSTAKIFSLASLDIEKLEDILKEKYNITSDEYSRLKNYIQDRKTVYRYTEENLRFYIFEKSNLIYLNHQPRLKKNIQGHTYFDLEELTSGQEIVQIKSKKQPKITFSDLNIETTPSETNLGKFLSALDLTENYLKTQPQINYESEEQKDISGYFDILYCWVGFYKGILNQGFNLSSKEFFEYDSAQNFITKKNSNYIDNFFSLRDQDNRGCIDDISVFVGKNGSGKSSFIEFLILILDLVNNEDIENKLAFNSFFIILKKDSEYYYIKNNLSIPRFKSDSDINFEVKNFFYSNKISDIKKNSKIIYYSDSFEINSPLFNSFQTHTNISTSYLLRTNIEHYSGSNFFYDKLSFKDQINQFLKMETLREIIFLKKQKFILEDIFKLKMPKGIYFLVDEQAEKFIFGNLNKEKNIISDDPRFNTLDEKFLNSLKNTIENIMIENSVEKFTLKILRALFFSIIKDYSEKLSEIKNFVQNFPKSDRFLFRDFKYFLITLSYGLDLKKLSDFINTIESYVHENFHESDDKKLKTIFLSLDNAEHFIDLYFNSFKSTNYLNFYWGVKRSYGIETIKLSSGEKSIFSLFARLFYIKEDLEKRAIDDNQEKVFLFMDEIELYLHPEWQRRYINAIIKFIENIYNGKNVHLILTTHSPFVLSDIPNNNITFITDNEENNSEKKEYPKKEIEKTFAQNINILLKDSFFMESLVGDFAKYKINNLIEEIKKKKSFTDLEKENIQKNISIIGESIIRNKLESMYYDKLSKEYKISLLEKELKKLKEDQND